MAEQNASTRYEILDVQFKCFNSYLSLPLWLIKMSSLH